MEIDKNQSNDNLLPTKSNMIHTKNQTKNEIKSNNPSNHKTTTQHISAIQSYVESLPSAKKDKLIKEFEKEKIISPILTDLYKRK